MKDSDWFIPLCVRHYVKIYASAFIHFAALPRPVCQSHKEISRLEEAHRSTHQSKNLSTIVCIKAEA